MRPPLPAAIAHAKLVVTGSNNPALHHKLITLYSKDPSSLPTALRLFFNLPFPPKPASWTAVISAHSLHSPLLSLRLFLLLLRNRHGRPDQGTLSCLLKTFASSLPFSTQLHSLSLKLSLANLPFVGSALVKFYSLHGLLDNARSAFDEITHKDSVSHSAIVVALAQNRLPVLSLSHFNQMRAAGVPSTEYSISGALQATACLAGFEQVRTLHAHAVVVGLATGRIVVGTALVDAYGKAGMALDARAVFEELDVGRRNVATWNAVLAAYAQQGDCGAAEGMFRGMVDTGFVPDKLTFLAVMAAFGNAGMVTETERWLESMGSSRYGLEPGIEHYTCLVGALVRVGKLEAAEKLALKMPWKPDTAVWRTILAGCVINRSVELGRRIGQRLLELDPRDDSTYVMLANIYSAAGRKDDTAGVWGLMRDRGVTRERGRSWIEAQGEVHMFIAGDRKHARSAEIYEKVRELREGTAKLGYREEDEGAWHHSERLALAFAVTSGAAMEGKAVRVVKNLRICKGCHDFFKIVSRVLEREIVVRDVNRYHRFVDGGCTCRDYW